MIIGYDAKRAAVNATGLGNYSRFVIEALAQNYPHNSYRLYVPKPRAMDRYTTLVNQHECVSSHLPKRQIFRGLWSALWRVTAIRKDVAADGVDLFHGLSNELPIGIARSGVRSVVTIHDLIFRRYPKLYKPIDRAIYDFKFRYASRHADRIIAVSECTKRDIVDMYGVDPSKIDVVYQGCSPEFAEIHSEERKQQVRERYNLPQRFMFNVGTLEERKNLLLCVKALEHLDPSIHLVACGRATPYSEMVQKYAVEHGLSERVHLISKMEWNDLAVIYQCAEVFAYPSRFEGFGIPIIEALSSGIPTIAATGSCLEEAGGDAAIYVSPDDSLALAQAYMRFADDAVLRAQSIEKGFDHVQKFSKENIAKGIIECYNKVLNR